MDTNPGEYRNIPFMMLELTRSILGAYLRALQLPFVFARRILPIAV